ncbi:hypothetical protein [Nonomuraea sp. NPDC001699]
MIASGIKIADVAAGFGIGRSTLDKALSRQRVEAQAALSGDLPEEEAAQPEAG